MKKFKLLPITLYLILLLSTGLLSQEQTGSLVGTITNSETKEKIFGANVRVVGTLLGTTTNSEGMFIIRNLPFKQYSLLISMIGYETKTITDVGFKADINKELEIELNPLPVQTQPVIVTASKREQSIAEIPVAVSVMDAKEITYRNSVSVDDALRHVSGVSFIQSQVNIRGSTGYSKGVGSRVLLLIDGLPLLSGDTGEIIWESLPVTEIERIEVVKGAGSALFGSSALGGVINIITKSGSKTPVTDVQVYGGVYDSPYYSDWKWTNDYRYLNGIRLSHSQQIGNVNLFVTANRIEDEGYQENNHLTRWNGWAKAGIELSQNEMLTLTAGVLEQSHGNFLYWKDLQDALIPPDDQLTQHIDAFRWNVSGMYKQILSPETYFTFSSSWYRTWWKDNIPLLSYPTGQHSQADDVNGELQVVHQFSEDNILTGGLYGVMNSVHADSIFGKHTGTGFAVYGQDELGLTQQVRLTLGGRLDAEKLQGTEGENQFNPKVGLTYNPFEGTHIRFSLGRGFRAPSVAEVFTTTEASGVVIIPNPALHSEHSWSYELGGTQALTRNIVSELSLFQNEFWDLIEPTFNTTGQVQFENITRACIQGVEINLRSSWFNGIFEGDAGYTYIYPQDLITHDLLKYRPRHLLYISGNVVLQPVQAGADFRFISKADRIDDEFVTLGIIKQGDARVPAYITDLHVSLDWGFAGVPITSAFHVNNMFQDNYVELIGNIAPIRNYVLTLEGKF